MYYYPQTVVLRHKKENLSKCSLKGLEKRADFQFITYPKETLAQEKIEDIQKNYLILDLEADEELTKNDAHFGLVLVDGTWRYAKEMIQSLPTFPTRRKLPKGFLTAYPRRQTLCPNPEEGLASLEAIYIAYRILERETEGLLDAYYWKEIFLNKNTWNFKKMDDIINH